jgi:hypothetical protein
LTTSLTAQELAAFSARWRELGETLRTQRIHDTRAALLQAQGSTGTRPNASANAAAEVVSWTSGGGKMELGDHILLDDVTIVSPDGRLLVDHLSLQIPRGTNVMVTGTRVWHLFLGVPCARCFVDAVAFLLLLLLLLLLLRFAMDHFDRCQWQRQIVSVPHTG